MVIDTYIRESDHMLEVRYLQTPEHGTPTVRRLQTTNGHLFWRADEQVWMAGSKLHKGDLLLTASGKTSEITEILSYEIPTTVYNFDVADYESYYVNGVLVHQKCGGTAKTVAEKEMREFLEQGGGWGMSPYTEETVQGGTD